MMCVRVHVHVHMYEQNLLLVFFHLALLAVAGLCYRTSTRITVHNVVQYTGVN